MQLGIDEEIVCKIIDHQFCKPSDTKLSVQRKLSIAQFLTMHVFHEING